MFLLFTFFGALSLLRVLLLYHSITLTPLKANKELNYSLMGGRDVSLFVAHVDEDLLCPVCTCVLIDPHDTPCDHVFCYACIKETIKR